MYKIYKIEDIHGKIYIGKTKQKMSYRFKTHQNHQLINFNCSSSKLDLDFCIVNILEDNILKEDSKDRERYYINHYDCVNERKLNCHLDQYKKQKKKEYKLKNKDKIDIYNQLYRDTHKEEIKKLNKEYKEKNKTKINHYKNKVYHYQTSWGGEKRTNNNLLMINLDIFN